jgi:signal transduction histidine kinase
MHVAEEQLALLSEVAGGTLRLARASPISRPVDLCVLAEAALRMHQCAIESKAAHVVKDLRGDLVVEVCSGEIMQVMSNLMANALDAIPKNGTVYLRLRKSTGKVRIVVADNGHGMPREIVGQVFKPFFTTKDGRGTGLGLSLSKKIVDHHKGTIRLRSSVRPGRSGTAFQISFPA